MADTVIAPERRTHALPTPQARRRYLVLVSALSALALTFLVLLLTWNIPVAFGTTGFWRVMGLRSTSVVVLVLVAFCQAIATVSFQTVAGNRIITPSIMGFESLYRAVQTSAVYFFGIAGTIALQGQVQFVLQLVLMVGFAVALYGWLLSGRRGNMQIMLLVGVVLGIGLGSVASFMQRMLTPSEFDVLAARLFGSLSNADASYLPIAIPLAVVAGGILMLRSRRLDVVALGRDAATGLGVNHRRELMITLTLVSVLMAVSTALVGPMTFFGFLVAMLAYQLTDSSAHRYVFPVSVLIGITVLAGASFTMNHVFYAAGVVSVIIELVGGSVFLVYILRKGRL